MPIVNANYQVKNTKKYKMIKQDQKSYQLRSFVLFCLFFLRCILITPFVIQKFTKGFLILKNAHIR